MNLLSYCIEIKAIYKCLLLVKIWGRKEEHLHAKAFSVESRIYIPYFIFGTLLSYRIKFADQTVFTGNIKTFILPLENKCFFYNSVLRKNRRVLIASKWSAIQFFEIFLNKRIGISKLRSLQNYFSSFPSRHHNSPLSPNVFFIYHKVIKIIFSLSC